MPTNARPQVFTANTALLFEAEKKKIVHIILFCLLFLQVQIGGAVGICGHGGCSCSGHTVYGKSLSAVFSCLPLQQGSCYCVGIHNSKSVRTGVVVLYV